MFIYECTHMQKKNKRQLDLSNTGILVVEGQ